MTNIPVKCTRCKHQCLESDWLDKWNKKGWTDKVCPKCGCKSYYDMRPAVAWCWRDGEIEYGDSAPKDNDDGSGAIVIAKGPRAELVHALNRFATKRHCGELSNMYVPGVFEADTGNQSVQALDLWLKSLQKYKFSDKGIEFGCAP